MRLCYTFLILFVLFCKVATAQQKFQHTTAATNISANSSFLDINGLNNNPSAIIIVECDATAASANPHAVGVWYNGSKWAVFNQDRAAMPAGITFSITWKNTDENAFYIKATGKNFSNGKLLIDLPQMNNNPSASFFVSQVWNPDAANGVYNNSFIAVEYNASSGYWNIKNQNGTALPEGCAFNILVPQQTKIKPGINNIIANNPAVSDATIIVKAIKDVNLDFENAFLNWKTTGTAFSNQPVQGNTVTTDRVFRYMEYAAGGIGGDYWKGMVYPIGIKGQSWIGSYEQNNGDAATGTMTSLPFLIEMPYLTFLLGGGNDINKIYVELQVKKTDYEAAWGRSKRTLWGETEDGFVRVNRISSLLNGEDLYRYYFDLKAELNNQQQQKTIRLRIVDEKTSGWGHINVDDFVFAESLSDYLTITKNGYTLLADKDKPVWGFADIHAHWVNHIGLNGLMHGTPGGNWKTSNVKTDISPCDGFNHGLPTPTPGLLTAQVEKNAFNRLGERLADVGNATCGVSILASVPIILTTHSVAGFAIGSTGSLDPILGEAFIGLMLNPVFQACGYSFIKDVFGKHYSNTTPDAQRGVFVDFPRWNTFFHQLMHITWVRRSYEGGQRLMIVPVGTAKSWEFNSTADGRMKNPKEHIEAAVRELKRIVSLNTDWMEIAYTPQQAREIILQNKMAIIIGLEHAEVGSYFSSVDEEINWIEALGIRHVFPIHNINNQLGGAAVFNSALNSYNDLVNRQGPDDPIVAFKVREGNSNDETKTSVKLSTGFMRQNMRLIPIAGFGTIPFFYLNNVPDSYGYNRYTSHKNSEGLRNKGRNYIRTLMKHGMVIDIDHMSDLSQNEVVNMMNQYHYPMVAGHANFRELRRDADETDGGDKEARLKTEFTIFNSRVNDINNSGGMFGLMTQQNNIRNAEGCPVPNTSAGGTSSFIQAYWFTGQKTNFEKGIAFGSDFNGFAPQVSPRFGTESAYFLQGDKILNHKTGTKDYETVRRQFAFAQQKGVKYDVGINTWHYHRFPPADFLTQEERDVWEAIAIAKGGKLPAAAWQPGGGLSVERTGIQQEKIRNIAEGLVTKPEGDYLNWLNCPGFIVRDENLNNCMPERKAAFLVVNGINSLPAEMKTQRTMELFYVIKSVYDLWMQFENGPNEPLRRSFAFAGGRDFDYNIDGLAQYGMFPDMIQDMKNLGLQPYQLRPLFLATEQYLQLWEKAWAIKKTVQ